jgi:hypothetical protein
MLKSSACRNVALVVLLITFSARCVAQEGSASPTPEEMLRITGARLAIDRMIELQRKFDPASEDIYLDDAEIVQVVKHANGKVREFKITGQRHKQLRRQAMPSIRLRSESIEYSEVDSRAVKEGVRISVHRRSNASSRITPIQWLLVPDDAGNWRIKEGRIEPAVLPQPSK